MPYEHKSIEFPYTGIVSDRGFGMPRDNDWVDDLSGGPMRWSEETCKKLDELSDDGWELLMFIPGSHFARSVIGFFRREKKAQTKPRKVVPRPAKQLVGNR